MGHDSCTIPRARRRHRRLTCLGSLALGLFLLGLPGGSVGESQGSRAAGGGPPVLTGRLVAVGIPWGGILSSVGTSGALGTALLGPSPDGSGRAVIAVALADSSLVQVHAEHGVDGLAPAGTMGALDGVEDTSGSTPSVTRVGLALNWMPERLLYVADPRHNAIAVLTLGDNGSVFCLQRVIHFVNPGLNLPVDVAPAVPEVAHRGVASHTTLAGGSDLYVANRGNGTIVRLRQDGTVVAVRQVALPGRRVLGADRLSGIAVSPDAQHL